MEEIKTQLHINENTTLFLDRDGVINVEKDQDYIRNVEEFQFYADVPELFHWLNQSFKHIIVVTNQRGIGKGLMSAFDVNEIHSYLNNTLHTYQGNIHGFYFAPELENDAINRKPNIGMALQAKEDFPDIDFSNSVMVGNNLSDMEFGKKIGSKTVFVETTKKLSMPNELVDLVVPDFAHFCKLFII